MTEDWFVLSHFKPLLRALNAVADDVVVAARDNGRLGDVARLGVGTRAFDFARQATAPHRLWATARALGRLIERERPDAVHLVALKPIVLGAIALRAFPSLPVGVHLTGLGHLGVTDQFAGRAMRHASRFLLRSLLARPAAHCFVENEDDLAWADPTATPDNSTLLGGAGVNPDHFAAAPHQSGPLAAAYVGRLVRSKGVDVLIEAARLLRVSGAPVHLTLYGAIDQDNPEAFTRHELDGWQRDGLVSWRGPIADVRVAWRDADVAVVPSHGGEGLPRTLLEAAACARALIVTDVPDSRRFVRDGREGLVVPAGDAVALSQALARLAGDPALRRFMGDAARRRVLDGFTEDHVETDIRRAYLALSDLVKRR